MSPLALFKVVVALDLVQPGQEVSVGAGAREVRVSTYEFKSIGGVQHD